MNRFLRDSFLAWTERHSRSTITSLGTAPQLFGAVATPISWLYRAGVGIDHAIRGQRLIPSNPRQRLGVIASPLVGGVGKTPLVARIAATANRQDQRVAIITRGYASQAAPSGVIQAEADGSNLSLVGDEAAMLAQETGLPVYVARNPEAAVEAIGQNDGIDLVLLDDGVRRRWAGERRILVFSEDDLSAPCEYLPSGRWRIPPQHALPAHGVAIVGSTQSVTTDALESQRQQQLVRLRGWGFELPVGWYSTKFEAYSRITLQGLSEHEALPGEEPVAFCGLGHPSRFMEHLHELGLRPSGNLWFPDHHSYERSDLVDLTKMARRKGAKALITTHKDAVKIPFHWIGDIPIYVVRISLELTHGADMLSVILEPTE